MKKIFTVAALLVIGCLAQAQNKISETGNVGIGTTAPNYPLQVVHPPYSITEDGTNHKIGTDIGIYNTYNIPMGKTDNGYRMGLNIGSFVNSADFNGTLHEQYGIRIEHGAYQNSGSGTIDDSYGLFLQGLENKKVTITNKYGIFQDNASFKNIFKGSIGIGENHSPIAKLDLRGNSYFRGFIGIESDDERPIVNRFYNDLSEKDNYYGYVKGIDSRLVLVPGATVGQPNATRYVQGIYGESDIQGDLHGNSYGVYGLSYSRQGGVIYGNSISIYGQGANNGHVTGDLIGVYGDIAYEGQVDGKCWAGYFNGNTFIKGNVGIGCTSPDAKLVVKGTIKATEIKVVDGSALPCSDYVFENDYNLRPLEEIESFVKENKHLPEVPSAQEFKENGYSIGEMDDILLRKIEELTLYVIDLKKENEAQQRQIENLTKQNQALINE